MTAPDLVRFPRFVEPLRRVLPDRLQQPVPRRDADLLGDRERLLDEPFEQVEDVDGVDVAVGGHELGGLEVEAAREHREAAQHRPLLVAQQVVGPVDGGPQRLVALDRRAAATGQEPEALPEPLRDLRRRQRARPGGRELDRERDAVEAPADLDDRVDVAGVDLEPGPDRARPLGEQPDGFALERDGHARSARGSCRLATTMSRSPATPRPFAARREHARRGGTAARCLRRGRPPRR